MSDEFPKVVLSHSGSFCWVTLGIFAESFWENIIPKYLFLGAGNGAKLTISQALNELLSLELSCSYTHFITGSCNLCPIMPQPSPSCAHLETWILVHQWLVPNWSWLVLSLDMPPGHPGNLTGHAECWAHFVRGCSQSAWCMLPVRRKWRWSCGEWSLNIHSRPVYHHQLRASRSAYWHQLGVGWFAYQVPYGICLHHRAYKCTQYCFPIGFTMYYIFIYFSICLMHSKHNTHNNAPPDSSNHPVDWWGEGESKVIQKKFTPQNKCSHQNNHIHSTPKYFVNAYLKISVHIHSTLKFFCSTNVREW
jgi:hypothetical protein